MKYFFFLFVFLNTEYWLLIPVTARDMGTQGVIYPIEEEDPLQLIQQKLKFMEERGELVRHNLELQKQTKASVERPSPVEGMTRACKKRVFYYDPTYVVPEDLKDHTEKVFCEKETKINPLETVSLSHNLLFFNMDDPQQKAWAIEQLQKSSVKLILIKGAPLSLSEDLKTPVYFDQGGLLTKKLGIKHVPTLVAQEGLRLRIEEISLQGEKK